MNNEVLYLTEIEGVEVLTDSNSGMGKVIFCRDKAFAENVEQLSLCHRDNKNLNSPYLMDNLNTLDNVCKNT